MALAGQDPVPDDDADEPEGAVDNDYDDAAVPPKEELANRLAEVSLRAPLHDQMDADDLAIDLVTRHLLRIESARADSLPEYCDENAFDLATYKQAPWLPVCLDDSVFECVFVSGIDDLHSEGKTYDYPAGRLARVPIELSTGGPSDE